MKIKTFFDRFIRGWMPEEPKMSNNWLTKTHAPTASYLRFTNSLKIVYTLTLGFVATWFLGLLILHYWQDSTVNIFSSFLYVLPTLFFINTIPLSIFAVVFLTKGGGVNYFRSWNAGKKLQLSGYAILAGYISVMLPHLLNIRVFISPSHPFQGYMNAVLGVYSIFVYFGLSLMAIGFGSLFVIHKKSTSSGAASDAQKRKTTKRTVVLVFVIAVLTVSLVCLAGAHYNLQIKYDSLSEGFESFRNNNIRLVNEQWTDNQGTDSNYVNFKVGVLNIGYGKSYNVTVIVLVNGVGNKLLEREEIFVGDLDIFQYQELDVNIDYSGELDYVSAGYSWD